MITVLSFLVWQFSLTVPSRNSSNVTRFSELRKNYPSARCATVANLLCSCADISSSNRHCAGSSVTVVATDIALVVLSLALHLSYLYNMWLNCSYVGLSVVLYECDTWSPTLWEERWVRVFENRVLRRIFGPKRDEVTEEWRKLHNEALNDLYGSPSNFLVIK